MLAVQIAVNATTLLLVAAQGFALSRLYDRVARLERLTLPVAGGAGMAPSAYREMEADLRASERGEL